MILDRIGNQFHGKNYFSFFGCNMRTKRHNAKRRTRKNPNPPRYYSGKLFTKEETLNYIHKNYNLRILEDSNLQKILSNLESIKYISSGSQSDVFAIQINNKIFLDATDGIWESNVISK